MYEGTVPLGIDCECPWDHGAVGCSMRRKMFMNIVDVSGILSEML